MGNLNVSTAASLFKENGHDLKGIFQLFYNAVSSDYYRKNSAVSNVSLDGSSGINYPVFDDGCVVRGNILSALEKFVPDLDYAEKRLAEFNEDYKKLKELSTKIKPYGFWAIIFRRNKVLREYLEQRDEIEAKEVSLDELLQIAFYKFQQVRGTKKQFVDGFTRNLTPENQEKKN